MEEMTLTLTLALTLALTPNPNPNEGKPMMNAALLSSEIEGVHAHMADRAPKEDAMVSFIKAGREGWENGGRRLGK